MKLNKLFKVCDKETLVSVLSLSNGVRNPVWTIDDFINIYDKELLERKISHIEFDDAVVRIDIF